MNVVTEGAQVMIGGNETYIAMCHRCWREKIQRQKEVKANEHK
jgi:thymidine kinase